MEDSYAEEIQDEFDGGDHFSEMISRIVRCSTIRSPTGEAWSRECLMSRRLDWDKAKVRLGERIYEVTDEVPTVIGPTETGRRYLSAAIKAVLNGRSLPKPTAVFLRYYKSQFPEGSVESWLQKQPQYLDALRRREAQEAAAAVQKADKPKPTPARTKRSKPRKSVSPADIAREELRKLILRRRKEEGPKPPPVIEKRKRRPRKP